MIQTIIDEMKKYHPDIYTAACEEFPFIKPGDTVIDFSTDLTLFYVDGIYAIMHKDQTEVIKDPLPVLRLLLAEYEMLIPESDEPTVHYIEPDVEGNWLA